VTAYYFNIWGSERSIAFEEADNGVDKSDSKWYILSLRGCSFRLRRLPTAGRDPPTICGGQLG